MSLVRDKGAQPASVPVTAQLLKKLGHGINFNALFSYNLTLTQPKIKEKNPLVCKSHIGYDPLLYLWLVLYEVVTNMYSEANVSSSTILPEKLITS